MISVRATLLESVRKNPAAFGQLLAEGEQFTGGRRGMFRTMVDIIRLVHIGELDQNQAVQELYRKFLQFNDTQAYKTRQERLIQQMIQYLNNFEKKGFHFLEGSHRMQWAITEDVRLTGMTPWVITGKGGYFSFILSEHSLDWKSQLRFPLFQQYLTEYTIECDPSELQLGFYFMDVGRFDFKSFSPKELMLAIDETGEIFTTMYKEFSKKKE